MHDDVGTELGFPMVLRALLIWSGVPRTPQPPEVGGRGLSHHPTEIVDNPVGPGIVGVSPFNDGAKVFWSELALHGDRHTSAAVVQFVADRHWCRLASPCQMAYGFSVARLL